MNRIVKALAKFFIVILVLSLGIGLISCSFAGNAINVGVQNDNQSDENDNKKIEEEQNSENKPSNEVPESKDEETKAKIDTKKEVEPQKDSEPEKTPEKDPEPVVNEGLKTLFLGDSIAEAIYGITPYMDTMNNGYGALVAKMNDYEYSNYAVAGYTTEDTYYVVKNAEGECKTDFEEADIIVISAIGNDFLNLGYEMFDMIPEYLNKDYTKLYKIVDNAKDYMVKTIKEVRKLNADATIMVQTLYNPLWDDCIWLTDDILAMVKDYGYTAKILRPLLNTVIKKVNSRFFKFMDEFEDAGNTLVKLDVYDAFNQIAMYDTVRGKALICKSDSIHPTSYGHAVIASTLQKKLVELNLAATNADQLANYKSMRKSQLEDVIYYSEYDTSEVETAIDNAKSIDEVTEAYFGFIRDNNVNYGDLSFELQEDGTYWVSGYDLGKMDFNIVIPSEVNGKPVTGIKKSAFLHGSYVLSLYIPNTVEHIEGPLFSTSVNWSMVIYCQANKAGAETNYYDNWDEDWYKVYFPEWSYIFYIPVYWGVE